MTRSSRELMLEAADALRKAGVPEARREAASLLQDVLQRDRAFLLSHPEYVLSSDEEDRFRHNVNRRASGEPLQYITGTQAFFGLNFEVTKDVLIPRPETELLVESALKLIADTRNQVICDVGTGSGCIAISIVLEHKGAAAIAIDISEAALRVAQRNAARHSVTDRISFVASDCFAAIRPTHTFDLIVSNPPYVAGSSWVGLQREVRDHEPRVALLAGQDGLGMIRRLLIETETFVRPGGHLLFEIGFDQGAAVEEMVNRRVWNLLDIQPDLQGIPRLVLLQKISSL